MLREFYQQRLKRGLVRRLNNLKIAAMARKVARLEPVPFGAPVVFFKASSALVGPDDDLIIPKGAEKVDWEVELAVVIGALLKYSLTEGLARWQLATGTTLLEGLVAIRKISRSDDFSYSGTPRSRRPQPPAADPGFLQ